MRYFITFLFFCYSLGALSRPLTTMEKMADFDLLNITIKSSYGPFKYKQEQRGLNYQELKEDYLHKIHKSRSNLEFYKAMVQYVAEFQDGHFAIRLPTDFKAEIPVMTDLIDGQVLITQIDRTKLSENEFPFKVGDEIVAVDQRPTEALLAEIKKHFGVGFELGQIRAAAQLLLIRPASVALLPEKETVEISVRRDNTTVVESVILKWQYSGTPFDEDQSMNRPFRYSSMISRDYDWLSSRHVADALLGPERMERSYRCSGGTRIAIPEDATIIMKTPFVAYYHPTEKGNVGYLRIPHYSFPNRESVFKQYEYALHVLEQNTVGLIIDQDHNCGGSVDFLHAIMSLFMDKPFKPMQFELLATKKEYYGFKGWMSSIASNTFEMINLEKVLALIKSSWEKGAFLTPKTSIGGEEWIYPNPVRYTKPIVMLIDELSGSGGDAFPALMKGYHRATLLGTRTAGMGGHIEQAPTLMNSGMMVYITKSLFYRPDGVAVENNGAEPDIQYTPTRQDLMNGYKDYQSFYLKALMEKI